MIPEILSPAGSFDSLTAALRAGADAVYLGTGSFNARRNAANFTDNDLMKAAALCHRQGAKLYVTLNTLINDDELPRVLDTVELICHAGADGVIVQDLGVARLIRQAAPSLHLHASTQMSIHSPAALPLLKDLGFTRVVAAREMSLSELRDFCDAASKLGMEVEVFVHGALCMCVSGQCYLSAMLGGRSGSRGLCAQPCRLPFSSEGGTGFDLSLKDLSLISRLDMLRDIGVASFKIEGRMKRPEYVAAATAACRNMLDFGCIPDDLNSALSGIFSRSGFTAGYFEEMTGKEMFGRRTDADVQLSKEVLTSLHGLYRTERQTVELTGSLTAEKDGAELRLTDGENTVSAFCDTLPSDKDMSRDFVLSKLSKLGGTNYYLKDLEVNLPPGVFIQAGALSQLRKQCTEQLDAVRSKRHSHKFCPPKLTRNSVKAHTQISLIGRFDRPEQIPDDLSGLKAVSLPIESDFEKAVLPENIIKIIDIPRGIFGKEAYIAERLELAVKSGFTAALCGNLSAFPLAKAAGLNIIADFGINIFNSHSLDTAAGLGAKAALLSCELTAKQMTKLSGDIPAGAVIYGRIPLMLTRNCPIKNGTSCAECGRKSSLTDRKGIEFPVLCRLGCSELLNSRPIVMSDRLKELSLDFGMLYFTTESKNDCANIIEAYISGKAITKDYTRGLFYRGVE